MQITYFACQKTNIVYILNAFHTFPLQELQHMLQRVVMYSLIICTTTLCIFVFMLFMVNITDITREYQQNCM